MFVQYFPQLRFLGGADCSSGYFRQLGESLQMSDHDEPLDYGLYESSYSMGFLQTQRIETPKGKFMKRKSGSSVRKMR